jgi:hypothetical protein
LPPRACDSLGSASATNPAMSAVLSNATGGRRQRMK